MSQKSNLKVPLFQKFYFVAIILLIGLRIFLNNVSVYVNLANYMGMVVSVAGVFLSVLNRVIDGRERDICKGFLVIISITAFLVGFVILIFEIQISAIVNDIFTLFALLFCICNLAWERIIIKVFSLTIRI